MEPIVMMRAERSGLANLVNSALVSYVGNLALMSILKLTSSAVIFFSV